MNLGHDAWHVVRTRTHELLLKNSELEHDAALVRKYVRIYILYTTT